MDDQRFDQLARSLARSTGRRGVLKGLVGVIGGALGVGSATTADARTRDPNGTPCDSPRDCASGLCVDGVCCDGACMGTCEACNSAGVCAPVVGAPVGNRGPCPGGDGICSGQCDGVTTASCAGFPGGETVCGEVDCANGKLRARVCSGNGICMQTTSDCGLFPCAPDGLACLAECAGDDDCVGAAFCVDGSCQGDLGVGSVCDGSAQCQTGACVNGVCCSTACDGECESCGADGFCRTDQDEAACDGGVCCHGDCTPLGTDANCLSCGHMCVNGETCCPDGCQTLGDEANCGYCGDQCATGAVCCNGVCIALGTVDNCEGCHDFCDNGEQCCLEGCAPLGTDANCGACGDACLDGQGCCGDSCISLGTDENCGACGDACGLHQSCSNGECFCASGYTSCDAVCVMLGTDQHCGACGHTCGDDESCSSAGECTCDEGFARCGDICIVDTLCCTDADCAEADAGTCATPAVCDANGQCVDPVPLPPGADCPDGGKCDGDYDDCHVICTAMTATQVDSAAQPNEPRSAHFTVEGLPVSGGQSPLLRVFLNGDLVETTEGFSNGGPWFLWSEYFVTCTEIESEGLIFTFSMVDQNTDCVIFPTNDMNC